MVEIKPGSERNSINFGSHGVVPVAVFTTADFDASSVDPATVTFADAAPVRWTIEDVNGDGSLDLLLHFRTQALNLDRSSVEVSLTGSTHGGTSIQGSDSVSIAPAP